MEVHPRIQSSNFFRAKLLTLTTGEQLEKFIKGFDAEQKMLRKEIVEICWYMRGSIARTEAWALSPKEREEIVEYIGERMKLVEKTKLPLI